jgi:hypothetical protein
MTGHAQSSIVHLDKRGRATLTGGRLSICRSYAKCHRGPIYRALLRFIGSLLLGYPWQKRPETSAPGMAIGDKSGIGALAKISDKSG